MKYLKIIIYQIIAFTCLSCSKEKISTLCYDNYLTLSLFGEKAKFNGFEIYPSYNKISKSFILRCFYTEKNSPSYKYKYEIAIEVENMELQVGTQIPIVKSSYLAHKKDFSFTSYNISGSMTITNISNNNISANLSLIAKNRENNLDENNIEGCIQKVKLIVN